MHINVCVCIYIYVYARLPPRTLFYMYMIHQYVQPLSACSPSSRDVTVVTRKVSELVSGVLREMSVRCQQVRADIVISGIVMNGCNHRVPRVESERMNKTDPIMFTANESK